MLLKMPKLSPTMEEGMIVKWHKEEGERVEAGDLLFEVNTDKAIVEHASLDDGYLRKILVAAGQEAKVGEPIGYFTALLEEEYLQIPSTQAKEVHQKDVLGSFVAKEGGIVQETSFESRSIASPLARKIAAQQGVDLKNVIGSGPGGRILKRDVEEVVAHPVREGNAYETLVFSPMRKAIAARLQLSKTTIPHFYLSVNLNASPLASLKEDLALYGKKVTINDFMIRAVALSLAQHPEVCRGFDPEQQTMVQFFLVYIAVAVSVEGGLTTPIVRDADQKSLVQISEEVRLLAKKAKEGKLQPSEYLGGSFSISNLGMYGVSHFQAIINPPQAAILAVGAIEEVPVVQDGVVVPGKQMVLTLSADHRVMDGATSALFLKTVRFFLEHPVGML